jgi:hypothetical protein
MESLQETWDQLQQSRASRATSLLVPRSSLQRVLALPLVHQHGLVSPRAQVVYFVWFLRLCLSSLALLSLFVTIAAS